MLLSHHHLGPQLNANHQNAQNGITHKTTIPVHNSGSERGEREVKIQHYPVNLPDMNKLSGNAPTKRNK